MTDINPALQTLLQRIWRQVESSRDKLTDSSVKVPALRALEHEKIESRFGNSFPALSHLDRALELAANHALADIAAGFVDVIGALRWSQNPSYNETNCPAEFLNGYAYAGFAGPDSPIRCSVPRGGLMMMAPGVTYPGHKHAPIEIYLVFTPGVQWRLDEGEWFDVEPGDMILHQRWQIHSMRTTDEPMLAFAGWLEEGVRQNIDWSGD